MRQLQRPILPADTVALVAIHLAGGRVQNRDTGFAAGAGDDRGRLRIGLDRVAGVSFSELAADLRGEMNHAVRFDRRQATCEHAGLRKVTVRTVVTVDLVSGGVELADQMRADESLMPGDQDAHSSSLTR